ncbi:hypothetical protein BT96DRAFT_228498 [Gymnopus androsaceus JB14]|uniref:F-box domain-containing protein n=1 Tax=Gymnopus androsaceus JB14 TaxID=1447944 RepID=A0A6A4H4Y1_9AGAR|nr:hypothetical protein BT96DRAFT_228498 [Gymnopus androsaceus JB14]
MDHSRRWKSFLYDGDHAISVHLDYEPTLAHKFPVLDILEFTNLIHTDDLDVFQKSSKIRALTIYDPGLVSSQIPSWIQVTDLNLCASYEQLEIILDKLPNLTFLRLVECSDSGHLMSSCLPPRTSNTIDTLHITVNDCDTPQGLLEAAFSSFSLPFLTELRVLAGYRCKSYNRKWPQHLFAKFLSLSLCRITTFVLERIGLSDTDLITALQLLSSLVTLKICDYKAFPKISPITPDFISCLRSSGHTTHIRSNSHLVPKLRYLSLDFNGRNFDDMAFVSMVSSRWFPNLQAAETAGVDCLRSVVLRFRKREVDQTIYRPLQYLDKMGLMVVVRGTNDTGI